MVESVTYKLEKGTLSVIVREHEIRIMSYEKGKLHISSMELEDIESLLQGVKVINREVREIRCCEYAQETVLDLKGKQIKLIHGHIEKVVTLDNTTWDNLMFTLGMLLD